MRWSVNQKRLNTLTDLLVGETLWVKGQGDEKSRFGLPVDQVKTDPVLPENLLFFCFTRECGCDARIHVGQVMRAGQSFRTFSGKLSKDRGYFFVGTHFSANV